MNTLSKALENIEYLKPQAHENMTIIGLKIEGNDKIDLLSLEKGLDMGLVEITETNAEGSVSEVKVINKAVTPLLLLDGEEIIGSKQNRIINTTVIIPANSEKIIPVSCTEAGRWDYESKYFKYSSHMATSKVRNDKIRSVTESLRSKNQFVSNQIEVWDNIELTESKLNVSSQTRALHDSFTEKSNDIEDYKKAFPIQEKQNGLIVYINGKLVGCEIVYNTGRFKEYYEKLVESYILDAITQKDEKIESVEISQEEILEKINAITPEIYSSVGLGEDYRLEDEDMIASAMLYEENLINASIFVKS